MARQKNKKKQGRKQQSMGRENKVHPAGLGDTVNLVGRGLLSTTRHSHCPLRSSFGWSLAGSATAQTVSSAEAAVGTSPEFWVPWRRQIRLSALRDRRRLRGLSGDAIREATANTRG